MQYHWYQMVIFLRDMLAQVPRMCTFVCSVFIESSLYLEARGCNMVWRMQRVSESARAIRRDHRIGKPSHRTIITGRCVSATERPNHYTSVGGVKWASDISDVDGIGIWLGFGPLPFVTHELLNVES